MPIWERLNVELLLTQLVAWLPRFASAILIFAGFWITYRVTRPGLARVLNQAGVDHALQLMLQSIYRFTLLTFGAIMAVNQLGINVGAALAGLGVVGLAVGFAAKDTLSNTMAGFLIFWDKPFHTGDWVTLNGNHGKVTEITMRTTRLLTSDNTLVIIPNETVINQVLVNHSANRATRMEVNVTLSAKENFSAARETILQIVAGIDGVLPDPPVAVVVKSVTAANAKLMIQVWIAHPEDERPVSFRILEAIKPVVEASGAASAA